MTLFRAIWRRYWIQQLYFKEDGGLDGVNYKAAILKENLAFRSIQQLST